MRLIVVLIVTTFIYGACKTPKATSTKQIQADIDTLIIRNICNYCKTLHSTLEWHRKEATTPCICYDDYYPDTLSTAIFKQKVSAATNIKHLIMENPSVYIGLLPFEDFANLHSIYMFGNDYNMDGLKTFPKSLLSLKKLKSIEFEDVRFDKKELECIKKDYPHINIIGKIDDY
jgi:hypothetical protein